MASSNPNLVSYFWEKYGIGIWKSKYKANIFLNQQKVVVLMKHFDL